MEAGGCPNASPQLLFLDAEDASRKKFSSDSEVLAAYDCGIESLATAKHIHLEGFLNEKAGFDAAKRGSRQAAERYFNRALEIYNYDWGAIAKYTTGSNKRVRFFCPRWRRPISTGFMVRVLL
jgi:hypothetical protein